MGDFRVHHCRFFDYIPTAIHCLAYEESQQKIALSRADGSIEIWSIVDDWYQEKILPPSEGRSVEGLLWCGTRLISAGLHGDVHEHDLLTSKIKHTCSSYNGAVWCLTQNKARTYIAAGTEEGCVVLFEVTDTGLDYHRVLNKQEGRILSIAWYDADDLIVTGGIDSIRIWSLHSGHAIQRLTMGRATVHEETIVWTVAVTQDFTIVSGDSRGKTCFWNGRQGTLLQSFQSHNADVLAVVVNKEGNCVYSAGIDPTVVQFEYIPTSASSDWKSWIRSSVKLQHSNDVRALALTNDRLVSAGVDCQLILNKLKQKEHRSFRKISPIPQTLLVTTAQAARIVMLRHTNILELWRLGSTDKQSDKYGEILALKTNPVKLLELKSKSTETIVCAAISQNAEWVVYSTMESLRVFQLSLDQDDITSPRVSLERVRYLPAGLQAACCMTFLPDSSRLVTVTTEGKLHLVALDSIQSSLLHTFDTSKASTERETIHLLATSLSGKYLATADHASNIHIYNLHKLKRVCSLPKYSSQPTALGLHPTEPEVVVAYANQKIFEYSISEKEYTEWSRKLNKNWHPMWVGRHSKLLQISYNPHNTQQLFLRDEELFCILDKTQPFPEKSTKLFVKKKDDTKEIEHAFHICTKYKYLMHLDILPDGFLLVVERPPFAIMDSLPDTLKSKKFGT